MLNLSDKFFSGIVEVESSKEVKDYVKVSGNDINTISVYNSLGALVERIDVDKSTTLIDLSEYNAGVYFINIEQNNGVSMTQKMVVTK